MNTECAINAIETFETYQMVYAVLAPALWLNESEAAFLMEHPEVSADIVTFLSSHQYPRAEAAEINLSNAIASAYVDYFQESGEAMLELWDVPDTSDPMWDIMKEQLVEMIVPLLADFVPGGSLATIGPELFDNLQEGNWMDAMYNAVDIVLNEAEHFVPAAKVASFGYGLAVTSVKLTKFVEAIKKVKSLGDDVAYKVYQVMRNKFDDVFSNFEWVNQTTGTMVQNVGDPLDIWEDFIEIFDAIVNPLGGNNGAELIATFTNSSGAYELKAYYDSNTHPDCLTISIRKTSGSSFTFKMRFCD